MVKTQILLTVVCILLPSFVFFSAYGDGLASETLPPAMIGNRNVTLSINSSPFLIGNNNTGTQINLVLQDADNQEPLPYATIAVSVFKNNTALFGHVFMSDSGNFLFDVVPDNSSSKISINEEGGLFPGFLSHGGNYEVKGPVFASGGLYKFKIDVLTMGSYDTQISKSYNAAISIPETKKYQMYDRETGDQNVTIIAYYDQIGNFHYDTDKTMMSFSMPFNWSPENVKQVSVIHQELKIPRSFTNFIVTKYDAKVNGIKLNDRAISIDDYSSDDRIVHLIVYKQDLYNIVKQQQNSKPEMDFTLSPSNETAFPIIQYSRNALYKISLSWDPPKILAGHTTKFSFQILDPYLENKTIDLSMSYDFSITGKNGVIFHKRGITVNGGGMNTVDVNFPANYTGPITMGFENLNGNSFTGSEFSGFVSYQHVIPEFSLVSPILLAGVIFMTVFYRLKFGTS